MAKTYYDSQYDQDSIIHSYSMGMSAPFDSRAVVDTTQDLYTKSTFKYAELYVGMVVVTLDTNDIYVLSLLYGKRLVMLILNQKITFHTIRNSLVQE